MPYNHCVVRAGLQMPNTARMAALVRVEGGGGDYGPDSGLFLRSTMDGKAYQAMIDYHDKGNLMGIYGEGLGGVPHVRNFDFDGPVTKIKENKKTPFALPIKAEDWPKLWKHGSWNELKASIQGNPPRIQTWINGVKFMDFQEEGKARHPDDGHIALQVHGGGDFTRGLGRALQRTSFRHVQDDLKFTLVVEGQHLDLHPAEADQRRRAAGTLRHARRRARRGRSRRPHLLRAQAPCRSPRRCGGPAPHRARDLRCRSGPP